MRLRLKPTTLPAIFHSPQLAGRVQEVADTIVKIIKAARTDLTINAEILIQREA
jgi:DNA-directed RNA polymerase subunit H (RpoH/RPB5)